MQTVRIPMESLIQVILLQLETGGKATLTVTGYSMLPMLRQYRDSVLLEPVKGSLQPGDIGLFRRDNGKYVLHRVIRQTPEGYLFCGDNQAQLEPVRRDQLIARVCGYIRKGKNHQLDETGYRLYCWLSLRLFGIRKYYIRLRRGIGCLRRRFLIRRNKNG